MAQVLVSGFFLIFFLERIENAPSCVKIAISLPGKAGNVEKIDK